MHRKKTCSIISLLHLVLTASYMPSRWAPLCPDSSTMTKAKQTPNLGWVKSLKDSKTHHEMPEKDDFPCSFPVISPCFFMCSVGPTVSGRQTFGGHRFGAFEASHLHGTLGAQLGGSPKNRAVSCFLGTISPEAIKLIFLAFETPKHINIHQTDAGFEASHRAMVPAECIQNHAS